MLLYEDHFTRKKVRFPGFHPYLDTGGGIIPNHPLSMMEVGVMNNFLEMKKLILILSIV